MEFCARQNRNRIRWSCRVYRIRRWPRRETFEVKPGFDLQLAAAEPLVADPIAMSFDAHGRLYVVEMIGYSERREANAGRIRRLEDTDGDGRFEKSVVFADDSPGPRR